MSNKYYPIPQNTFNNIKRIAPGIPSIPTIIDVIIFKPIWKSKDVPIILIIQIASPPRKVFNINLNIFLIGNRRIFPKIKIKIIQVITETIIVISITITWLNVWWTKYNYANFSTSIPFSLASFINPSNCACIDFIL